MDADLIRQIDTLSQAFRVRGYEVKTTIKLNRGTFLFSAKPLSEQDIKQLRETSPEIRVAEGG